MGVFSINCSKYILNGEENTLGDDKIFESVDNKEVNVTFFIECDGEEDNNSFVLDYYGDEKMIIERNRCELRVHIEENKTPNDKEYIIKCTHSNDSDTVVQILIIHKAEEFKLEIAPSQTGEGLPSVVQNMKSIVAIRNSETHQDSICNFYENFVFFINLTGGNKRFKIESIVRCHVDTENDNQIIYHSFDNGFVYTKLQDRLIIRNYGRPFMDENDYYLIKLYHQDKRDVKGLIKLVYDPITTGTRNLRNNVRPVKSRVVTNNKQICDIYMPYEEFMERIEQQEQFVEEMNRVECSIKFREEIGEEFVIIGQRNNVVLPFDVYENGEISDLMVKTYSSGGWCSVTTDRTNRNLIIKIFDKPITERKSMVKVSIVDYPSTYILFVLTNKVS